MKKKQNKITGLVLAWMMLLGAAFFNDPQKVMAAGELPASYRSNEESRLALPATRNQDPENLGWNTCWAFAADALAEINAITEHNAPASTDLSEMGLAYLTYNSKVDPIGYTKGDTTVFESDKTSFLTYGGSMDFALETMAKGDGLIEESYLPYSVSSFNGIMSGSINPTVIGTVPYRLDAAYTFNFDMSSISRIKELILSKGAVATSYYAGSSKDNNGKPFYDEKNNSYYYTKANTGGAVDFEPYANHAMVVVGWDDDFPADAFATNAPGNGAWLVRNSWSLGNGSSKSGYFWLSYFDESLGRNAYAISLSPKSDYDNCYQYDGGILSNYTLSGIDTTSCVNVFRAGVSQAEVLSAVAIHPNKPCRYSIRIYKGMEKASDPVGGTLVSEQSGSSDYAGFFTVPLSVPVALEAGEYFSVEVVLSGARMTCEYGSDNIYVDEGMGRFGTRCSVKAGQSFVFTEEGYKDITDIVNAAGRKLSAVSDGMGYGNVRIKAYTKNAGEAAAPLTVKGFKAKKSAEGLEISWDSLPASNADGYQVFKQNKKGSFTVIKKVTDPYETTFTYKPSSGTLSGVYRIRAVKTVGDTIIKGKAIRLNVK